VPGTHGSLDRVTGAAAPSRRIGEKPSG